MQNRSTTSDDIKALRAKAEAQAKGWADLAEALRRAETAAGGLDVVGGDGRHPRSAGPVARGGAIPPDAFVRMPLKKAMMKFFGMLQKGDYKMPDAILEALRSGAAKKATLRTIEIYLRQLRAADKTIKTQAGWGPASWADGNAETESPDAVSK